MLPYRTRSAGDTDAMLTRSLGAIMEMRSAWKGPGKNAKDVGWEGARCGRGSTTLGNSVAADMGRWRGRTGDAALEAD